MPAHILKLEIYPRAYLLHILPNTVKSYVFQKAEEWNCGTQNSKVGRDLELEFQPPYLIDGETQVQKVEVISLGSHSKNDKISLAHTSLDS